MRAVAHLRRPARHLMAGVGFGAAYSFIVWLMWITRATGWL